MRFERQRLYGLLDTLSDGVCIVDPQRRVIFANRALQREFGPFRPGACHEYLQGHAVPCATCQIPEVCAGAVLESQWTSPRTGRTFELIQAPFPNEDGTNSKVAIFRDITGRIGVEEDLARANEVLRAVFEASPVGVVAFDRDTHVTIWNHAAERIFGWRSEEVVGTLPPYVPAGHEEEFERRRRRVLAGEVLHEVELVRKRRDGSPVNVRVSSAPLRDGSGAVIGIMSLIADISETSALREQFRQAQRLEGIARLAGGVAHDFNNLLTVINGYSELLLTQLAQHDPHRREVEQIHAAGQRAARLTAQLLAFSRKQVLRPRALDVNAVVTGAQTILTRLLGEDVLFVLDLEPAPWTVEADENQLVQVLMNLVANARDAMPGGGSLWLRTRNVTLGDDADPAWSGLPHGDHVVLEVEDTGTGMPPAVLTRLFEPFFTTKPEGKGTGLGLSTVYGIVRQSGGHVLVESSEGRGSTFRVLLPRAGDAAERQETGPVTNERDTSGTETILIVEDEIEVRRLTAAVLRRQGYTVVEAGGPQEALAAIDAIPGEVHLVLTDVVMPGMSGPELVERLRGLRPGLRALFMSGYPADRLGAARASELIEKPFTSKDLAARVRDVLSA